MTFFSPSRVGPFYRFFRSAQRGESRWGGSRADSLDRGRAKNDLLCSKSSTIYLTAQLSVPSLLFVVIKKLTPQVIYSDAGNQGGLLLGRSHYSAT